MSRKKRSPNPTSRTTDLDQARNELFGHINRCGVVQATEEQQAEWMADTIEYIGECHPSLSGEELEELKAVGLRFCRPAIPHGVQHNAVDSEAVVSEAEDSDAADSEGADETAEEVSTV